MSNKKYDELIEFQKLKESGAISEEEFEIEKYNILNSKNTTSTKPKKNMSKQLLKFAGFLIILAIIFGCIAYKYYSDANDLAMEYTGTDKEMFNKIYSIEDTGDRYRNSAIVFGGVAVVSLVASGVLKVKEKGGIKIVN